MIDTIRKIATDQNKAIQELQLTIKELEQFRSSQGIDSFELGKIIGSLCCLIEQLTINNEKLTDIYIDLKIIEAR